nr:hypothetical protein Iba_chr03aCG21500 [Ipomoea batatas]
MAVEGNMSSCDEEEDAEVEILLKCQPVRSQPGNFTRRICYAHDSPPHTKGDAGTSDPKLLVLAADILLGPLLCGSAREFTKSNTKAKTSSSPYKDKQQFCKSITFEETGLLENLSSLGLGSRQSSAETTSSSSPAASVSGWICILGRNLVPVLETLNEIPILRCLYSSTSASDYDLNRIKSGGVVDNPEIRCTEEP